mmetsp:Transcript_10927/g.19754  ORF Transcript_10927/g.19754 Transcript_10927/m.19754 type:complete len:118 (-) Transcript_10927:165-518(-)
MDWSFYRVINVYCVSKPVEKMESKMGSKSEGNRSRTKSKKENNASGKTTEVERKNGGCKEKCIGYNTISQQKVFQTRRQSNISTQLESLTHTVALITVLSLTSTQYVNSKFNDDCIH